MNLQRQQVSGLSTRSWRASTTAARHLAPARIFFWWFLVDFWEKILVLKDRILGNTGFQRIRPQRDRDDQFFEAVSSRGKEWCVVVPPNYCHGPVRSFWAKLAHPDRVLSLRESACWRQHAALPNNTLVLCCFNCIMMPGSADHNWKCQVGKTWNLTTTLVMAAHCQNFTAHHPPAMSRLTICNVRTHHCGKDARAGKSMFPCKSKTARRHLVGGQ